MVGVGNTTPQTIFSKSNWTEFITDEILQVFKDNYDDTITRDSLKEHSFDYLPFDIQNLINTEVQAREEKAKTDSFKQEKKCSTCGEVLAVEEANGQKFFTCKNGGDLFHREGISKKSLDEDFAYLQENGFYENLVVEHIAKSLYKTNKAKGLKAFMELQGTYYEKRPHYAKGFFHKVQVEKNLVLEINEKVKGEGTLVAHIYNKADMEFLLVTDLKYWKVLKVESVGYGHVTTKSYTGYYQREYDKCYGDDALRKKVDKEYSDDKANTESFLVTFQRINTAFDQAILQKYIDKRISEKRNFRFHDAVTMIPTFNVNPTPENAWYGISVEDTRNWGIARTKILGKEFVINTEFEKQNALGSSKTDEKTLADFKKRYNKDLEELGMFNFGQVETVKQKQTSSGGMGEIGGRRTLQKEININDLLNDILNKGGTKSRDRNNGMMQLWTLKSGLDEKTTQGQIPDFLRGFVTEQQTTTLQKQPQQVNQDLIQKQLQIQKNEFWNINDLINTKPPKENPPLEGGLLWPKFFLSDDQNPKDRKSLNTENLIWGVGDKPLEYLNFELGVGENEIKNLTKKYKLKTNEWYG